MKKRKSLSDTASDGGAASDSPEVVANNGSDVRQVVDSLSDNLIQ